VIDNAWQHAADACRKATGADPTVVWSYLGPHSGVVSFGATTNGHAHADLVLQVFPRENDQEPTTERLDIIDRYNLLNQLAAVGDDHDSCAFVEPVACVPEHRCIITRHVMGHSLTRAIGCACSRLPRGSFQAVIRHVRNVASWLARLDTSTRKINDGQALLNARIQLACRNLSTIKHAHALSADQADMCEQTLKQLADTVQREHTYSVLVHGDLCPANVLVDTDRAYIIDIHTTQRALPGQDAARFATLLHDFLAEPVRYSTAKIDRLEQTFLATYGSHIRPTIAMTALQTLSARIQALSYHAARAPRKSIMANRVNRRRIKHYVNIITAATEQAKNP